MPPTWPASDTSCQRVTAELRGRLELVPPHGEGAALRIEELLHLSRPGVLAERWPRLGAEAVNLARGRRGREAPEPHIQRLGRCVWSSLLGRDLRAARTVEQG